MSRATRIGSALAGLVMAAGMLIGAPAAHAQESPVDVMVSDTEFTPKELQAKVNDWVIFQKQGTQLNHSVTSVDGLFDLEFTENGVTGRRFTDAGSFAYYCKYAKARNAANPQFPLMDGVIVVSHPEPPSTTTTSSTTTTTIPATTTTTATTTPPTSATTTPTTRPATTSTTRPAGTTTAPTVATTATTAPKPSVQGASEPTTPTTKKKSTTTTAKKKKATPSTVKVEETTTTTTMMPSLAAALPSGQGETPTPASEDLPDATEAGEEAASWVGDEKGGKSGGGMLLLFGLGGIGALGLGGAAWGWYHRSSRYLSA